MGTKKVVVKKAAPKKVVVKKKAVVKKAVSKKNSKLWTEKELGMLKSLYSNLSNIVIAKRIGRPIGSVIKKAFELGYKKDPEYKKKVAQLNNKKKKSTWSKEDVAFLKKSYKTMYYKEIDEKLKRPLGASSSKAIKLGLCKYTSHK